MMNLRLARPEVVIDLNRIQGLAAIEERDGDLVVGAMTRQSAIEESALVERLAPALHEAIRHVGHRPTRNRGTVGGSIVHADPSAEIACVWVAHEGQIVLESSTGKRTVSAQAFFRTYFTTDIRPDEIAVELRFSRLPMRSGWGFREFARRRGDFALLSITALVSLAETGKVDRARIVAGAASDVPLRVSSAEEVLLGNQLTVEVIAEAAEASADEIDPSGEARGDRWYRGRLAQALTSRALNDASKRLLGRDAG